MRKEASEQQRILLESLWKYLAGALTGLYIQHLQSQLSHEESGSHNHQRVCLTVTDELQRCSLWSLLDSDFSYHTDESGFRSLCWLKDLFSQQQSTKEMSDSSKLQELMAIVVFLFLHMYEPCCFWCLEGGEAKKTWLNNMSTKFMSCLFSFYFMLFMVLFCGFSHHLYHLPNPNQVVINTIKSCFAVLTTIIY